MEAYFFPINSMPNKSQVIAVADNIEDARIAALEQFGLDAEEARDEIKNTTPFVLKAGESILVEVGAQIGYVQAVNS